MLSDLYSDLIRKAGFRSVGQLRYLLDLRVYWHPEARIQLTAIVQGTSVVLKGCKSYFLQSITEEGETWARDIGLLQDWLEAHFSEVHAGFSYYRDIDGVVAAKHLERKRSREAPRLAAAPRVEQKVLRERLATCQASLRAATELLQVDSGSSELLRTHEQDRVRRLQEEAEALEEQLEQAGESVALQEGLQREYAAKGSAACFTFTLSSNLQSVDSPEGLEAALASITRELTDLHRYQVHQKLGGGKLNIQVAEASEPTLVWLETWMGGVPAPRQLDRQEVPMALRKAVVEHLAVTPREDIRVDGVVKEPRKLLPGRVISTWLSRLDRRGRHEAALKDLPPEALPVNIGAVVDAAGRHIGPAILPLARLNHCYISGSTGSGKSYLARVLVEEAAKHEGLNILVLDPRNQAAGILVPEDRTQVLGLYRAFGMKLEAARGFPFAYHAADASLGQRLPHDLQGLASKRTVISFKGLEDGDRCVSFSNILDAAFEAYVGQESERLRLLVVIEEAQRFTKKRVAEEARAAGTRAENALDRTVREGRKYGCCVIIVSQTIRDFSHDSASIRQNTNTKAFLHNSDREIEYAADFLEDGRDLVGLAPGTAILVNAAWGAVRVKVRPPLSKVWEFGADETRQLLTPHGAFQPALDEKEQRLLSLVQVHAQKTGEGLPLTSVAVRLGLTSRRRLHELVASLERTGLIRSVKLRARGQPRLLFPNPSEPADGIQDASGTETEVTGHIRPDGA